jgi:hypothetical protein
VLIQPVALEFVRDPPFQVGHAPHLAVVIGDDQHPPLADAAVKPPGGFFSTSSNPGGRADPCRLARQVKEFAG